MFWTAAVHTFFPYLDSLKKGKMNSETFPEVYVVSKIVCAASLDNNGQGFNVGTLSDSLELQPNRLDKLHTTKKPV